MHRLKRDLPAATIVLNGGLNDWRAIDAELEHVDGVMLGRTAYHEPFFLAQVDERLFGDGARRRTRAGVIEAMVPYVERQVARGTPLRAIVRHMLGLYHGQSGGRRYRQLLSDARRLKGAGAGLLREALGEVEPELAG